jgi:hypothetical protein
MVFGEVGRDAPRKVKNRPMLFALANEVIE